MASDWFTLSVEHGEGTAIVRIAGELDLAAAPELMAVLDRLTGPVIVDCQELAFIDASGLGVFADAIRRNGEIVLYGVAPELRRVFQVAGVAELASSEE